MNDVTGGLTGSSSYFVTINDKQLSCQLNFLISAKPTPFASCPTVSLKVSFISNRTSSETNRHVPLAKPRACSTDVSCLLCAPSLPVYIHILDGTSWLQSGSRLFTDSPGKIRNIWRRHMKGARQCFNTKKSSYKFVLAFKERLPREIKGIFLQRFASR